METVTIRQASRSDAGGVAALFAEGGANPYGWSVEKWLHYYEDYPEGEPVSLVATVGKGIVGHYGMLPIRIGGLPSMLGLHAIVSKPFRVVNVIAMLMKAADRFAVESGAVLICGFANPSFALIKKTFFGWKTAFWIRFKTGCNPGDFDKNGKRFHFDYSDDWYSWRFGTPKEYYLSRYMDANSAVRKQLLKVRNREALVIDGIDLRDCECWSSDACVKAAPKNEFAQPFSMRILCKDLDEDELVKPGNWHVEMGDSDTFVYSPWSG